MAIIIDKGALCICVRKSSNVILLTKEMKFYVVCENFLRRVFDVLFLRSEIILYYNKHGTGYGSQPYSIPTRT